MNPTQEQLAARIRDSGQVPFYTAPIAVSSLGNEMNTAGFPTAPNTAPQYNAATAGAISGAALPGATAPTTPVAPTTPTTPAPVEDTSLMSFLKKYLPGGVVQKAPTSLLETRNTLNTSEDIAGKTKEVNDLTAQLKTITDSTTAGQLGLETKDVSTTQGIVDRKQGQLARENAIKALPIAAALNAAQGRLDTAKGNITEMLGLIAKDNELNYQFEKDQIDYAMQFANADQKDALQKRKDELDAKKVEDDRFATLRNGYVDAAIKEGDFATAGKLAAASTKDELSSLSAGITHKTSPLEQAQIDNLRSQILERNNTTGSSFDPASVIAYAQQYASTGQIPTGLPKGTFGVVSEVAKELPKVKGEIVDNNTNIKSGKLTATQADGYAALRDLTNKLTEAKTLFSKLNTGFLGGTFGNTIQSNDRQAYNVLRGEITDLLARARTGAAISATEEALYKDKIPGTYNQSFFIGASGENKLDGLNKSISDKLDAGLRANGVSMYGFSKVKLGGKEYTVGDVIDVNGTQGRVNPDGSITKLN